MVFGRDLGQIIRPDREKIAVCSSWSTVPLNTWGTVPLKANLLVADVACLEVLISCNSLEQETLKRTKRLAWHSPEESRVFKPCNSKCNPVQKLLKTRRLGSRTPDSPETLQPRGAVIFGRPKSFKNKPRCHALPIVEPSANFQDTIRKKPLLITGIVFLLLGVLASFVGSGRNSKML